MKRAMKIRRFGPCQYYYYYQYFDSSRHANRTSLRSNLIFGAVQVVSSR